MDASITLRVPPREEDAKKSLYEYNRHLSKYENKQLLQLLSSYIEVATSMEYEIHLRQKFEKQISNDDDGDADDGGEDGQMQQVLIDPDRARNPADLPWGLGEVVCARRNEDLDPKKNAWKSSWYNGMWFEGKIIDIPRFTTDLNKLEYLVEWTDLSDNKEFIHASIENGGKSSGEDSGFCSLVPHSDVRGNKDRPTFAQMNRGCARNQLEHAVGTSRTGENIVASEVAFRFFNHPTGLVMLSQYMRVFSLYNMLQLVKADRANADQPEGRIEGLDEHEPRESAFKEGDLVFARPPKTAFEKFGYAPLSYKWASAKITSVIKDDDEQLKYKVRWSAYLNIEKTYAGDPFKRNQSNLENFILDKDGAVYIGQDGVPNAGGEKVYAESELQHADVWEKPPSDFSLCRSLSDDQLLEAISETIPVMAGTAVAAEAVMDMYGAEIAQAHLERAADDAVLVSADLFLSYIANTVLWPLGVISHLQQQGYNRNDSIGAVYDQLVHERGFGGLFASSYIGNLRSCLHRLYLFWYTRNQDETKQWFPQCAVAAPALYNFTFKFILPCAVTYPLRRLMFQTDYGTFVQDSDSTASPSIFGKLWDSLGIGNSAKGAECAGGSALLTRDVNHFLSLYSGLSSELVMICSKEYVFNNVSRALGNSFGTYSLAKNLVTNHLSFAILYPAKTVQARVGGSSNIFGLLPPTGVVRNTYHGWFDCISTIFKEEGVLGFYKGIFAQQISNTAILCSSYVIKKVCRSLQVFRVKRRKLIKKAKQQRQQQEQQRQQQQRQQQEKSE